MFRKAAASHNAEIQKKTLQKQFFSSSPPIQQSSAGRNQIRPLSNGSANIMKLNTTSSDLKGTHVGIKRSASGLAKALSRHDAFEEPLYPQINSQWDGTRRNPNSTSEVFFDENDFDSDVDLDVENPASKGTVAYPKLPALSSVSPPVVSPTLPRQAPHVSTSVSHDDSGYQPIVNAQYSLQAAQVDSSAPLPGWSSSPPEHINKPNIQQFAFDPLTVTNAKDAEKPKPSKRRILPWLEQQEVDKAKSSAHSTGPAKSNVSTPRTAEGEPTTLAENSSTYSWNTTASTVKAQQKKLRETKKNLTKAQEVKENDKITTNPTKMKKQIHKMFLSEEQHHVLNLVIEEKKSVFFTGSAGTGKSVLLREIIRNLRTKYLRDRDRVAVTASTGLAACNIGGVTLHSFAGIGLGKEEVPELVKKIRRNQKAKNRWMRTKVLIVDEISMVDGELFDKLEEIARIIRNNGRPFGGIQLVITGDFFQLPPVPEGGRVARFCFDAHSWNTVVEHTIGLHHVFRQKDPEFASMLNEMRQGRLTPSSVSKFRSLSRPLHFADQLEATELFPTRAEVDAANITRMQNLQGELRIYEARDGGAISDKAFRDKLLANCMAPETICLKKGAQVMLIKNMDDGLVNGSLGKVIGFMSEATFESYQRNEEEYYATQPQNSSGENGEEGAWEGTPELSERKLKMRELVAGSAQVYPVVRFAIADGTTRDLLCQREPWKIELPSGEVQASRSQIPLILAWALSIHKAQGQTLERVKVDLGRVFEKGQAYVALSRATSMNGLQVLRFDPSKVNAHERVRNFYAGLARAEVIKKNEDAEEGERQGKKQKVEKAVISSRDYEEALIKEYES